MRLGLKTCTYTILKAKLQNDMLLTRLQWLIIMRITNSDGNCGKIIIATLFCTLLIGIRITTMYSSATTKVVATPITTTNVRESYEIKDGVPVETIITSFGPDPPPGELVPGGSIKQDGKKSGSCNSRTYRNQYSRCK